MLWSISTRVELAGHERREVDDAAVLDARPFAVRSRQDREHAALVGRRPRPAIASPRRASRRECRPRRASRRRGRSSARRAAPARRDRRARSSDAGQSTYGASTQPWRLPIMPHAMRGAARRCQSPSSFASAVSNRPSRTCLTPSGTLRRVEHARRRRRARYARAADVPQSIATSAVADKRALPAPRRLRRRSRAPRPSARRPAAAPSSRTARASSGGPSTNSQASNAMPRCALVTTTSTIWSPGASAPTRWMTSASRMSKRRLRLVDDVLERRFGHARIVLERQPGDRRRVVDVAHGADERGDRADAAVARAQPRDFARRRRNPRSGRGRSSDGGRQPPVTGGKIATSSPSDDRLLAPREPVVDGEADARARERARCPGAAAAAQRTRRPWPTVGASSPASSSVSPALPNASRSRAR